jgi:hypothetical protein
MKIDLKNAVITLKGSGVGDTTEVKIGEGTLTWTEKRNMEYNRDRGVLDSVREGDQEPVDVRMDFVWERLRADTGDPATPYEALTKTGAAAAWGSSSADACEPYAVDIQVVYTFPCGGGGTETILISDFRYESLDADPKAGTFSATGKANVTRPTITAGA